MTTTISIYGTEIQVEVRLANSMGIGYGEPTVIREDVSEEIAEQLMSDADDGEVNVGGQKYVWSKC